MTPTSARRTPPCRKYPPATVANVTSMAGDSPARRSASPSAACLVLTSLSAWEVVSKVKGSTQGGCMAGKGGSRFIQGVLPKDPDRSRSALGLLRRPQRCPQCQLLVPSGKGDFLGLVHDLRDAFSPGLPGLIRLLVRDWLGAKIRDMISSARSSGQAAKLFGCLGFLDQGVFGCLARRSGIKDRQINDRTHELTACLARL